MGTIDVNIYIENYNKVSHLCDNVEIGRVIIYKVIF